MLHVVLANPLVLLIYEKHAFWWVRIGFLIVDSDFGHQHWKCQTFDLFPELFTDEKPNDDCEYARIYGLKNKQRVCSIIWLRMHFNLVRATTLLKWKFEIANNNRLSINLNIKTITRGGLTQVYMYIFAHDVRDQEWLATSDWMPLLAIPNGELVERVQTGQRGFEHQFRQRRIVDVSRRLRRREWLYPSLLESWRKGN